MEVFLNPIRELTHYSCFSLDKEEATLDVASWIIIISEIISYDLTLLHTYSLAKKSKG